MSRSTEEYTSKITAAFKNVAKDNAIRNGVHDEGFNVKITKEDIRKGTNRSRVKEAVITSIVDEFNLAGFTAIADGGGVNVFVSPVLGNKCDFTLAEISEREIVVDEINARETYRLLNQ